MAIITFRFHRTSSDFRYDRERFRRGADFTAETLDRALRTVEGNLDTSLRLHCEDEDAEAEVAVECLKRESNPEGQLVAVTLRLSAPFSEDEIGMTAVQEAQREYLLIDPVR